MKISLLVLTTALLIIVAGSMQLMAANKKKAAAAAVKEGARAFPLVTPLELDALVKSKSVTVIDVNSAKSYNEGHVPGALHFAAIENKFAESLPKDKSALIVAYCGGPMCTAWEDAADAADKLGYTNVKHMKEGIKGWRDGKFPQEKI